MTMIDWLLTTPGTTLTLSIALAVLAWTAVMVKKSFFTHTISINKSTDFEEAITLSTNLSAFDSKANAQKKVDALFEIADKRRAFCHERMTAIVEGEQEKNLAKQGIPKIGA